MSRAVKHPVPDRVKPSFAFLRVRVSGCQITNDCLTKSGIGYFIAVPMWQQWASEGENTVTRNL